MAVTIHQAPDSYTPSGNPVVFTFSSDQTGQANFSYLVEVYVNATLAGRQQVFPESGIYSRIDCTSYAEAYTSAPVMNSDFSSDPANHAEIYIKVIERYGDPIADGANNLSNTTTVFKAALSNVDFINWDADPYTFDPSFTDNLWLTNFPSTETDMAADGEQKRLMIISEEEIVNLNLEIFDSNDASLYSSNTACVSAKIIIFNVGIQDLITATTATQANFDAGSYYVLRCNDGVTGNTESYRINIDRDCTRDTSKRVHFISPLGTMESFTYRLYSNISGQVTGSRYEREFGNFNGSAYEFNLSNGTNIDYRKRANKELLLRSNWLSEDIQQWLEEGVSLSPYTFIEDADDVNFGLRRVAVKKSQFRFKTTKQDTQFREDLTLVIDSHNSMLL